MRGDQCRPGRSRSESCISECLAVFIIIVIGCSAACMYTLYDPSPYQTAYWGVCITWGLSVTIAIYVTGAVSAPTPIPR